MRGRHTLTILLVLIAITGFVYATNLPSNLSSFLNATSNSSIPPADVIIPPVQETIGYTPEPIEFEPDTSNDTDEPDTQSTDEPEPEPIPEETPEPIIEETPEPIPEETGEMVEVIIFLKSTPQIERRKSDVLSATSSSKKERAIQDLQAEAFESQEDVIDYIEDRGGKITHQYFLKNGISARIPKDKLDNLLRRDDVLSVGENLKVYAIGDVRLSGDIGPSLDTSIPVIRSKILANESTYNYKGSGVKIAILDSGTYNTSVIQGSIVASKDFTTGDSAFAGYIDEGAKWNHTISVPLGAAWMNLSIGRGNGGETTPGSKLVNLTLRVFDVTQAQVNQSNVTAFPSNFINISSPSQGLWKVEVEGIDTSLDLGYYYVNVSCGSVTCTVNTTLDDSAHGTHVAATAAGDGGVANASQLLIGKVLTDYTGNGVSSGYSDDIIAGIEWALAQGVDIISMSLGGPTYLDPHCNGSLSSYVSNVSIEYGVVFTIAAGNEGSAAGTIDFPGCSESVITVGATYDNDTITNFSSRGPTGDGRVKPDV
ncbi:MAG: S8 family serine peptidase, partial [Candidatus Altiarchaeota archaeon]|nr:S8 family serine peptidase [Candidatus Altiarchaeota archaeon]